MSVQIYRQGKLTPLCGDMFKDKVLEVADNATNASGAKLVVDDGTIAMKKVNLNNGAKIETDAEGNIKFGWEA